MLVTNSLVFLNIWFFSCSFSLPPSSESMFKSRQKKSYLLNYNNILICTSPGDPKLVPLTSTSQDAFDT